MLDGRDFRGVQYLQLNIDGSENIRVEICPERTKVPELTARKIRENDARIANGREKAGQFLAQ